VVKLRSAADLPSVAQAYGLTPTPLDQFGTRPIFLLRIADGTTPPAKSAALTGDAQGRVLYAEPNFLAQPPEGTQQSSWSDGGNAGGYAAQWGPGRIRLPEAHQVSQGAGVTVAVLDTGVDPTHPALAGRLIGGYDFVDMDNDPRERGNHTQHPLFGHGTHVAGLVALAAPEARIMPVRVLDQRGIGNIWVLAEALAYAVDPDRNPQTDDGADVINLSIGTPRPTSLLTEIVADITCGGDDNDCLATAQRGAVVAAAAGNGGGTVPEYPGAEQIPGLLAVAASTQADTLAPFSTRGPWVQVAAPGDRILSSIPGGGYGVWSGTSMAAPFVAGQAALLRSADPGRTASETTGEIVSKAAPIAGPVPLRIDAAASLGQP
jgi:subtilisin family serine protease